MKNVTMSENSIRKSNWTVNIFKEWLHDRQKNGIFNGLRVFKDFEEMTKSELDSQLQYFVFEVRKKTKYPATTLKDIFQGIGY